MSTYSIYFSPAKGTEKIVKALAAELGSYKEIDLCKAKTGKHICAFKEQDICLIGVPSYGGRVPALAVQRIQQFLGNGAKAVLVVSYGNRAFEDTLAELQDILETRGFRCVGAAACIAEHSIMRQFAANRPDKQDKKELAAFGRQLSEKLQSNAPLSKLQLPGNRPYREYKGIPLKPKAGRTCTKCGLCAQACPSGAISKSEPNKTNKDLCISCMRCVQICPQKAQKLNPLLLKLAASKLKKNCTIRKENQFFL